MVYFETAQMGRRLVIAGAVLFFSHNIPFQFVVLVSVFATFVLIFATTKPYFLPLYNVLEFRLNASLTIILVLGFVFYADGGTMSAWQETIFAYLILTIVGLSTLFITVAGFRELRLIYALHQPSASTNPLLRRVRDRPFWRLVARELPDLEDQSLLHHLTQLDHL